MSIGRTYKYTSRNRLSKGSCYVQEKMRLGRTYMYLEIAFKRVADVCKKE